MARDQPVSVVDEATITASHRRVWDLVSDADRLGDWLAPFDHSSSAPGADHGAGDRTVLSGRWGGRGFGIHLDVSTRQPGRRITWDHDPEEDTGPVPPRVTFTRSLTVELEPAGGSTRVRLRITQRAQTTLDSLRIALGQRNLRSDLTRSLATLGELLR